MYESYILSNNISIKNTKIYSVVRIWNKNICFFMEKKSSKGMSKSHR